MTKLGNENKTFVLGPADLRHQVALLVFLLVLAVLVGWINTVYPQLENQPLYLFVPIIILIAIYYSSRLAVLAAGAAVLFSVWSNFSRPFPLSFQVAFTQLLVYMVSLWLSLAVRVGIRKVFSQWEQQRLQDAQRLENLTRDNERLYRETNKNIFDMLTMYEFTTILGSTLDPDEVTNLLVDTVLRVVRYDACCFWLVDEVTGHLECRIMRGVGDPGAIKDMVNERVVRTMQPFLIGDLGQAGGGSNSKPARYRSLLSLPLVAHGRSIGVLNLYKEAPNAFTQDELRVLFIIANLAAWAIKNAQLYEQMTQQAVTDGLTGLYNHRYFRESIERAVTRADETGQPLSMVMLDIDSFKAVNDQFGHQRGDMVIREVAAVIKKIVREQDVVARYGGEEFAIILPNTSQAEALQIAERIREAVREHDFGGLKITVSAGVATYPSPEVHSKEDLINRADAYAYRAKERGKDTIVFQ